MAFGENRPEEAVDLADRAADLAGEIGFRWWEAGSRLQAAEYALLAGLPAGDRPQRGLAVAHEIGDRHLSCYGLAQLAWVAAEAGDAREAGMLWGAAQAVVERSPFDPFGADREVYEAHVLVVAGPEFEHASRVGRSMSLSDAVEYALGP